MAALLFGGKAIRTAAGGDPPSPSASAAADESGLARLIAAGTLAGLRCPNFADRRTDVDRFYRDGNYALAWLRDGRPTPQAIAMIGLFEQAALKGLNPEDYDASRWDARSAALGVREPKAREAAAIDFDLALMVCAMRYLSDLENGRVNPQQRSFALQSGGEQYNLSGFLRRFLISSADVAGTIAEVEPPYAGYRRAEEALATYLRLAARGDGEPLPMPDKIVRPGKTYAGMPQLIGRLRQLGDLAAGEDDCGGADVYCGAVVEAVKRFQRRHGLQIDGILGRETIVRMNQPISLRVLQLELALERYRWLPRQFANPPIAVNIPEFRLHSLRGQPAPLISMKVVVGKAYRRRTPTFAQDMRYIIFRPYWNVPYSIVRHELIGKILRDREYLAANDFEVVDNDGNIVTDGYVSDDILSGLRSGALEVRQKPGPTNSLGLVKFMFPNRYNVYMHGTPATELFARARRDFSHGCIRVEDPVTLAAWVLRDQPEWDVERIRAAMNGDRTFQVNLIKPVPVLILYTTAVVQPDGEVRFFDDIYGYDASLARELAGGCPYPG